MSIPMTADHLSERWQVPIDPNLCREIAEWDADYQDTCHPDDPASSGFSDQESENRWIERGKELAGRLKTSLGDDVIVEFPDSQYR